MRDYLSMRRTERQRMPQEPSPALSDRMVRQQLAEAAGAEMFQHRDISYHLTENFCQTFDRIGQQKAARALAEVPGLKELPGLKIMPNSGLRENIPGLEHEPTAQGQRDMRDSYRTRPGQEDRLQRFADMAFQRGRLSAAILQGTGKMMLFSCLKRTAGQEQVLHERERMLFQASSSHRNVPHGKGNVSVANKGLAKSALGLVVDTLQDSRQSLLSLMALAESGGAGSETLLREYPFLSDAKERELLAQYRARLEQLKGPDCEPERQVLLGAEQKALAQIQKKAQMREMFLQKLRQLSEQALQAQLLFSQTETRREAAQVIVGFRTAGSRPAGDGGTPEPPEPPIEEGADADGSGKGRAGPGTTSRDIGKGTGTGTAYPADTGAGSAADAAHPTAGGGIPAGRSAPAPAAAAPASGRSAGEWGDDPSLGGWAAALAGTALADAFLAKDDERDDDAKPEPHHDDKPDAQPRPDDAAPDK